MSAATFDAASWLARARRAGMRVALLPQGTGTVLAVEFGTAKPARLDWLLREMAPRAHSVAIGAELLNTSPVRPVDPDDPPPPRW